MTRPRVRSDWLICPASFFLSPSAPDLYVCMYLCMYDTYVCMSVCIHTHTQISFFLSPRVPDLCVCQYECVSV